MFLVHVNEEACKGCGICIFSCPVKVLEMSEKLNSKGNHYPEVSAAQEKRCTGCRSCMIHCPDFAIVVDENEKPK